MKRLNFVLIIIGAVLLTQPIFAQTAVEAKIGVVDMNKLLQESPQAQDMQTAIEEEFAPRVRDISAKESAFNASRDQLTKDNLALSTDERQSANLKLTADQRELEYLYESYQQDRTSRSQIELNKIFREIIDIIKKYGRDNGYDLIINEGRIDQNTLLSGGTLYTGASVDITNDVAKLLEKKFQEDK